MAIARPFNPGSPGGAQLTLARLDALAAEQL